MCCSLDGMGRLLWWLVPSLLTVKAAPDFVLTLNQCLLYLLSPLKFLCSEWSLNYCYGYLPDPRQKWTFCNPLWFVLVSKETIRDSVYKLLMTALCVICIPFSVFSNLKFIPSLHLHWKSQSAWPMVLHSYVLIWDWWELEAGASCENKTLPLCSAVEAGSFHHEHQPVIQARCKRRRNNSQAMVLRDTHRAEWQQL